MKRRFSAFSALVLGLHSLVLVSPVLAGVTGSVNGQGKAGTKGIPHETRSEGVPDRLAIEFDVVDGLPGWDRAPAEEAFHRGRAENLLRSILRHPAAALIPASVAFLALAWGPLKHRCSTSRRRWVEMFLSLVFVLELLALLSVAGVRIARPVTWDFPHFYMVGRAAVQGLNYADPDVLSTVYEDVRMDPAAPPVKRGTILFKYFPMSALVLAYLGLLPYRSALIVHYMTQIAYLLSATVLLRRIGSFERSYSGYLTAGLLVMTFLPVYGAVSVAQIGFGALFWLVLSMCLLGTRPVLSGMALGVGFLYKHLLVIPLAFLAFVRRYSTMAGFVVFVVLTAIIIVALFGVMPFQTYVKKGPVTQNNQKLSDDINISLVATILRLSDWELPNHRLASILSYSPFVAVSLLLAACTILVCVRSQSHVELSLLSTSLTVLLALMLFPHVLYNTLPVALAPLFAIHSASRLISSFRTRMLVLLSIAAQYGIVVLRPYPFSFLMVATTWTTAAVVLILAGRDLSLARISTPG